MEETKSTRQQRDAGNSGARAATHEDHASCWVGSTTSLKTTTLLDISNSKDPPQALMLTLLAATEAKSLVLSSQQVQGLASQLQAHWDTPAATTPARAAAGSKKTRHSMPAPGNLVPYDHGTGMPQAPGSTRPGRPPRAAPASSSIRRCQASSKPCLSAVTVKGCTSFEQAAAVAQLLDVLPSPQCLQRLELCDTTHTDAQHQATLSDGPEKQRQQQQREAALSDGPKQQHQQQQREATLGDDSKQHQQQQQPEVKLEAVEHELGLHHEQQPLTTEGPQAGPDPSWLNLQVFCDLEPNRPTAAAVAAAGGSPGVKSPRLGDMWESAHQLPSPQPLVNDALMLKWSTPLRRLKFNGGPACKRLPISLGAGAAPSPPRRVRRRNSMPATRDTSPTPSPEPAPAPAAAYASPAYASKPWAGRGLQVAVRFDTRNMGYTGRTYTQNNGEEIPLYEFRHNHPWDLHQQHQLSSLWPLLGAAAAGLQEVCLEGACLEELPVLCKAPHPALTSLALRHCCPGISTSLPAALGALTGLQAFEASSCQLRELPGEVGLLTHLRRLCLADNHLQHLPATVLGLTSLQHLDLRNNCLEALPEGFAYMASLQELLLSARPEGTLPALPHNLWMLSGLKRLELRGGDLGEVPECVLWLTGLEELDIRSNALKALPPRFYQLRKLQKLDASHNQLACLPEQCSVMVALRHLELSNNAFETLPAPVNALTRLTYLGMGSNSIACLPRGLGRELGPLKVLRLYSNQLKGLPESLGLLSHLQELHIAHNHVACLPDSLSQLRHLRGLYAQHNQLRGLPVGFGALSALQELDLGRNYITELPAELAPLTGLQLCCLVGEGRPGSSNIKAEGK